MQNIDIIYVLGPAVAFIVSSLLVAYFWKVKGKLDIWIMLYSLAAYAIAIAAKVIFQDFTYSYVNSYGNPYILGLYFGLQTSILEVGLAYLFARYAISRSKITKDMAGAYGTGLAFWENGILLGMLPVLNILIIYFMLASGAPSSQQIYNTLAKSNPALFYPVAQALFPTLLSIMERMSSIMAHYSWGLLVVLAAATGKKRYLAIALPMGMVDFIVPFAGTIPSYVLELIVFATALVSLYAAKLSARAEHV